MMGVMIQVDLVQYKVLHTTFELERILIRISIQVTDQIILKLVCFLILLIGCDCYEDYASN